MREREKAHIDCIILSRDIRHLPNLTLHWGVEAMVVLWGQPKYRQGATDVSLRLVLVRLAEQAGHGEFPAFDPKTRGLGDALEGQKAAVGGADKAVGVVEAFYGAGGGLELAVEELIKCFCELGT